ncbi:gluconate 2-dehydrogenase subunit 3 family protein [Flavivirga aquimarina]|uniref:Gluconate 2-dehydrogenase subunit 3 family protein n=1 Tax=Flavivirga aquimarina TaxID=2027862 RepID=A0ABT8WE55_9FLAO|nr:gluconate 2-dehydrogenase subunit 3 family protein [Flavivirga aquimarina]MDO5971332.1 gluconate 2-dehydrogenase subunit 3 family protein [Flavivirga aquimarina]
MDRRIAIKNILATLGLTVSTSTIIGFLESCSDNKVAEVSVFFDKTEIYLIDCLVDVFLPRTSIVGGKDLNLTQFVDKMCANVLTIQKQKEIKLGLNEFLKKFEQKFNKEASEVSVDTCEILLDICLNISKEKEVEVFKLLESDYSSLSKHSKSKCLLYRFLTTVREFSFLGYFTSEIIIKTEKSLLS